MATKPPGLVQNVLISSLYVSVFIKIVGSYIILVKSSNISFLTSTLTPISILCDSYGILYLSANSWSHLAPVLPGAIITFFVSTFFWLFLYS